MARTVRKQYEYDAQYIRVVDGDTYEFILDLGFDILHRIHVRLVGASVVEMEGDTLEEGAWVANYVHDILKNAKRVEIHSQRRLSFKRVLGYVYADGLDIGAHLVEKGMATVTHIGWKEQ